MTKENYMSPSLLRCKDTYILHGKAYYRNVFSTFISQRGINRLSLAKMQLAAMPNKDFSTNIYYFSLFTKQFNRFWHLLQFFFTIFALDN